MSRAFRALAPAWLALTLLLSGCMQQLFGSLDESAANLVVSALRLEGIGAEKEATGEDRWRVLVSEEDFARAVEILKRRNLPPQQFDGLGHVFHKDSLVSTPTEERARLIHAMSQELERSLMEMDGVVSARVHPVIPPYDPLNPTRVGATASVLVKYRPNSDIANREAMIRALVSAGVEGLTYEDVRVLLVPADWTPVIQERPTLSRSVPPMFWAILGVLIALLFISYYVLNWRDRTLGSLDTLRARLTRAGRRDGKAAPTARGSGRDKP